MTLAVRGLSFSYRGIAGRGPRRVIDSLDLRFQPGVTAVVGPNGSGKSTLLRLLLGLLRPTAGIVELDGSPPHALRGDRRARVMAYVPQRTELSAAFSVAQFTALGRYAHGGADHGAMERALRSVALWEERAVPFEALSAGQQQRATVARALAQLDPAGAPAPRQRWLLADEPLSALDPAHAAEMMTLLRRTAAGGVAVIVVLHDLTAALRGADRAVVLSADGRLLAEGPTPDALTPATLRTAFGIGFERVNAVTGPAIVRAG